MKVTIQHPRQGKIATFNIDADSVEDAREWIRSMQYAVVLPEPEPKKGVWASIKGWFKRD